MEAVAKQLYGSNWNKNIDDLSDAFYANYLRGTDIKTASDLNPGVESAGAAYISTDLGL